MRRRRPPRTPPRTTPVHADRDLPGIARRRPSRRRTGARQRIGSAEAAGAQRADGIGERGPAPLQSVRPRAATGGARRSPRSRTAVAHAAQVETARALAGRRHGRRPRRDRPGSSIARAKSLAVPTGTTASGTAALTAAAAAQPIEPSPPATTIRSGCAATARSASSRPNSSTSAPAAREQARDVARLARSPSPGCSRAIANPAAVPVGPSRARGSWRGPRAPSPRSCWWPCASSERLLQQLSRLAGRVRRRALPGPERAVDALLRPSRGIRGSTNARIASTMQTTMMIAMGI